MVRVGKRFLKASFWVDWEKNEGLAWVDEGSFGQVIKFEGLLSVGKKVILAPAVKRTNVLQHLNKWRRRQDTNLRVKSQWGANPLTPTK